VTSLVDDLTSLRKRARTDRHGYWFPLLLMGVLTLAAIPLYQTDIFDSPTVQFRVPVFGLVDPVGVFSGGYLPACPKAIGLYWLVAPLLALAATTWWYRWRAGRIGVETPLRPYTQATVAGFAAALSLPLARAVLPSAVRNWGMGLSRHSLLLGVTALVVVGVVGTVFATRMSRPARLVVPMVVVLPLVAALTVHQNGGLLLVAIGLLVLSWLERSWLCATVSLVLTGFTLLGVTFYTERMFRYLGWVFANTGHSTLYSAQDLLLPGAVLVVGGVVALIARRRVSR
jgi:hypothetical protein